MSFPEPTCGSPQYVAGPRVCTQIVCEYFANAGGDCAAAFSQMLDTKEGASAGSSLVGGAGRRVGGAKSGPSWAWRTRVEAGSTSAYRPGLSNQTCSWEEPGDSKTPRSQVAMRVGSFGSLGRWINIQTQPSLVLLCGLVKSHNF